MRGHLTEKADVFGFGVVILETLSGRPNTDNDLDAGEIYLLDWVGFLFYFVISLLRKSFFSPF